MPRGNPTSEGEKTIKLAPDDTDVTTINDGGNNGTWETVLDVVPSKDIEYHLPPRRPGLDLYVVLKDSADAHIPDSGEIRFIAQSPLEEDTTQISRKYRYGEFRQANQRDEDERVRLRIEGEAWQFTEGAHFKMQLDNGTAVDWANCDFELEVVRRATR